MLNHVEITSQEAAWYLLREPMSKCSTVVTTIPTMWPVDRQRIRKTQKALDEMGIGEDSTNIWRDNWFDKYEKRHQDLNDVTLAQFVANYTIYDENENLILSRRKDFESNLDNRKTIEICRCLCRDDDILDNENDQEAANRYPEPDPYQNLFQNANPEINNADIRAAVLNKLGPIAKKKI
ncbi:ATP-dependent DNA helicase [Trichonephila clavipes]|nr:ATP-dependent DNA helicase [Trichonephila clavipes]